MTNIAIGADFGTSNSTAAFMGGGAPSLCRWKTAGPRSRPISAIPHVRRTLFEAVPGAVVVDGDRFGSVGIGLALEAGRRFGELPA